MGRKRKNDNQSNAPSAKLLKRMVPEEDDNDDSQDEIDEQQYQNEDVLNPLFLFEILATIFSYLNVASLKRCRRVCKLWGFEGGKILLKNSNLKLDCFTESPKNSDTIGQLEYFLSTKGSSAPFNSSSKLICEPDSLKNILPLLLQRTTTLSLNPFEYSKSSTRLAEFLEFFPNLQILHLESCAGINKCSSAGTERSLLSKFESLKEIRLKFQEHPVHNLLNILLDKTDYEFAVKEIHLQGKTPAFFKSYLEFEYNWQIDTLVMTIRSPIVADLKSIQPFLEKISESLKHLEWTLSGRQKLGAAHLIPWANNLINPSPLNLLETFEIFCDDRKSCASDYFWLLFSFAVQLPSLKKLIVNKVLENLERRLREWNNHPDAAGRALRSESLEELEIIHNEGEIPVGSFAVFSRRLWPNLKSLWIENPPDNLPTSGFLLSEWIGLERLDLKFGKMRQKTASLWTKWLTGRENPSQDDSTFTLKDLKGLKHFGLSENSESHGEGWEGWNSQRNRIASDFLVDNSLKFMTQLQSLYLKHPKISPAVQKKLEEALGPNVHVEFKY